MKMMRRKISGFTLVEVLVTTVILAVLLGILLSITGQVQATWNYTRGKLEQFRQSRAAFESISRRLSQATLNTYWDYDNVKAPTRYERRSELRFITGPAKDLISGVGTVSDPTGHAVFFQAPIGFVTASAQEPLNKLLNTWGYYIDITDGSAQRPGFIPSPSGADLNRFRLIEFMEPAEDLTVYQYSSGKNRENGDDVAFTNKWFLDPLSVASSNDSSFPQYAHILADNIVALVLLPKLSEQEDPAGTQLSPDYTYDSTVTKANADINPKNQLPPVVQVTLAAIDEVSAGRMSSSDRSNVRSTVNGLFSKADSYEADLDTLKTFLTSQNLNHRIYNSNVNIRAAKWSREQTN